MKASSLASVVATGTALGAGLLLASALPVHAQAQPPCGQAVTIGAGDTLFSIAQRCDTTVAAIQRANPGIEVNNLQIGQTVSLTDQAPTEAPTTGATPGSGTYSVEPGDTPSSIAERLGIGLGELMEANPERDFTALLPGQVIIAPETPEPPPTTGTLPDGRFAMNGVLTGEGVECQAMRGNDGELYTLIGDLQGHQSGDVVRVTGSLPKASPCQQGTTIEVNQIGEAN